jgi:hypothetical protein
MEERVPVKRACSTPACLAPGAHPLVTPPSPGPMSGPPAVVDIFEARLGDPALFVAAMALLRMTEEQNARVSVVRAQLRDSDPGLVLPPFIHVARATTTDLVRVFEDVQRRAASAATASAAAAAPHVPRAGASVARPSPPL